MSKFSSALLLCTFLTTTSVYAAPKDPEDLKEENRTNLNSLNQVDETTDLVSRIRSTVRPPMTFEAYFNFYAERMPDLNLIRTENWNIDERVILRHRNVSQPNNSSKMASFLKKNIEDAMKSGNYWNSNTFEKVQKLLPLYNCFYYSSNEVTESQSFIHFYKFHSRTLYPELKKIYPLIEFQQEIEEYLKAFPKMSNSKILGEMIFNWIIDVTKRDGLTNRNTLRSVNEILPIFSHLRQYPKMPTKQQKFVDYFDVFSITVFPDLKAVNLKDNNDILDNILIQNKDNRSLMEDYLFAVLKNVVINEEYQENAENRSVALTLNSYASFFEVFPKQPPFRNVFMNFYDLHANTIFPVLKMLRKEDSFHDTITAIQKEYPEISLPGMMKKFIEKSIKNTDKDNKNSISKLKSLKSFFTKF